ncbi:hypothetical protein AOC36_00910 [Erysipelothrix larvae]|uniref:ABC transporter ATP-binding protein n=1 Tax=Erysipelothrix larvae TaxID=1514105 RepID=A0A0X8GY77_9FIRM|nr:ABC transporter ATP-binding protein [Erysipelothrix larvae]AMC92603.1 hypothetical protein AOC36_00910 [Erysipelothrix larvae]
MNKKKIFHTLYRISKLGSYAFLLSIFGSMIGGFINYLFSFIIGELSRVAVQQATLQHFDMNPFITLGLISILALPLLLCGQTMTVAGGLRAENNLKTIVVSNTLSHDEKEIKDTHTGDLMARLTSDAAVIEDFYFQGLNYRVINPFVSGLASLITIFALNIPLGFVSIVFGLITFLASSRFAPSIQKAAQHMRAFTSSSTRIISEILSNEETIRLSNAQEHFLKIYHEENTRLKDASVKTDTYSISAESLNSTLSIATQITYLIICAYLSLNHNFDFASILVLIRLQPHVSYAFGNLSASWNYFVEISVSAHRILEVIDTQQEDTRNHNPILNLDEMTPPSITFDHVTFSYTQGQSLFNDLSLEIPSNQTIAFVGESGSGKSSLFQLLLGFYNPTSGVIKLNNHRLSDFSLDSCRSHMIYIQQEAPLFNRTIYENIALGSKLPPDSITQTMVEQAAKEANIHEFIQSLPQGYDTKVGENANQISGGQKQRIAIARAFMSDAPILIMDEPTSALDSESETLIQEALNRLKTRKTVLIAAHRLSTIKEADSIIVLDHGKIIEEGSHQELLKKKGTYYNYARLQSKLGALETGNL